MVEDDGYTSIFLSRLSIVSLFLTGHGHLSQNGAEALEFIEASCGELGLALQQPYSQPIMLDINMAVIDGFSFLEAFQQLCPARKKALSIIMLACSENKKA